MIGGAGRVGGDVVVQVYLVNWARTKYLYSSKDIHVVGVWNYHKETLPRILLNIKSIVILHLGRTANRHVQGTHVYQVKYRTLVTSLDTRWIVDIRPMLNCASRISRVEILAQAAPSAFGNDQHVIHDAGGKLGKVILAALPEGLD